jgi:hypothetical protein
MDLEELFTSFEDRGWNVDRKGGLHPDNWDAARAIPGATLPNILWMKAFPCQVKVHATGRIETTVKFVLCTRGEGGLPNVEASVGDIPLGRANGETIDCASKALYDFARIVAWNRRGEGPWFDT